MKKKKTTHVSPRGKRMTSTQKITYILEVFFNASSPETAVPIKKVIDKGIELGWTSDYSSDHRWTTLISYMVGVGDPKKVWMYEKKYIHRMKKPGTPGFVYWVDYEKDHISLKSTKSFSKRFPQEVSVKEVSQSMEEKLQKMKDNPGKYRLVYGKLISEEWIKNNPEKFKTKYGWTP